MFIHVYTCMSVTLIISVFPSDHSTFIYHKDSLRFSTWVWAMGPCIVVLWASPLLHTQKWTGSHDYLHSWSTVELKSECSRHLHSSLLKPTLHLLVCGQATPTHAARGVMQLPSNSTCVYACCSPDISLACLPPLLVSEILVFWFVSFSSGLWKTKRCPRYNSHFPWILCMGTPDLTYNPGRNWLIGAYPHQIYAVT